MTDFKKTLLLILDGWGIAPDGPGNCVNSASTPHLDEILNQYPSTRLACSGRAVGLPEGFMGNSEVGHMNIGGGRILFQDMTRIDVAIENGSYFQNSILLDLMEKTRQGSGRLHLMGLVSDGGVHSHQDHIYATLELAKQMGITDVFIHAFLDGRDTPPSSSSKYIHQLQSKMKEIGVGQIATVSGRFWAMDRDQRYERVERAYKAIVEGTGVNMSTPIEGIEAAYAAGETDEFIAPGVVNEVDGRLGDDDGLFFFNFRADRAREISKAIFLNDFGEFTRGTVPDLACFATMTQYEDVFPLPVVFPPESYSSTLGEIVSQLGMKQLRIAETEKYAHVTYFFNCGRENPFENEDRIMVASPRDVATYDLKPQMSAAEVTDGLIEQWDEYDFCVCNLANLDMVGHTGIIEAATRACVTVDECVGKIVSHVLAGGGRVMLTADHGNAEQMVAEDGSPHTAHSMNQVPLVYIEAGCESAVLKEGVLGDIAPTILALWGVGKPEVMTGNNLIVKR